MLSSARWRRVYFPSAPFLPSDYTTNLAAGIYLIEFARVDGRVKPPSQAVQIKPGLPTVISENYLLAESPPAGVLLPVPVPGNRINDIGFRVVCVVAPRTL